MLWSATGTFDFWPLFQAAESGALHVDGLTTIMFLIYLGAVGKSAQFPLHIWLPDAMEGPTPVSALIHAATMVTAGVYMVARATRCSRFVPSLLVLIAWVGAFTALLAATMACVERDIKRVLAYSTISQLGYMMAANGAGAPEAAFEHLTTHGVFQGAAVPRRGHRHSPLPHQRRLSVRWAGSSSAAVGGAVRSSIATLAWPACGRCPDSSRGGGAGGCACRPTSPDHS